MLEISKMRPFYYKASMRLMFTSINTLPRTTRLIKRALPTLLLLCINKPTSALFRHFGIAKSELLLEFVPITYEKIVSQREESLPLFMTTRDC